MSGHSLVENMAWELEGNLILLEMKVGVYRNSLNLFGTCECTYQNRTCLTMLTSRKFLAFDTSAKGILVYKVFGAFLV